MAAAGRNGGQSELQVEVMKCSLLGSDMNQV